MIPEPDEDDIYELVTSDPALAAVYQYYLSGMDVGPLARGQLADPVLYIDEDILRGDR